MRRINFVGNLSGSLSFAAGTQFETEESNETRCNSDSNRRPAVGGGLRPNPTAIAETTCEVDEGAPPPARDTQYYSILTGQPKGLVQHHDHERERTSR